MSQYTIYSNQELNWNAKGQERILQNVINILNTYRYEVAFDRVFGRNTDNIDRPNNEVIQNLIAETYELIEQYEPRAKVVEVNIYMNEEGEPVTKVVLEVG